jgi:hypothetical protein
MKKVLLALLVILTASMLIFAVGCNSNGPPTPIAKTDPIDPPIDPIDPPIINPVPVVVFRLSDILADIVKDTGLVSDDFDGTAINLAGRPEVDIISVGGKKALKIKVLANWGQGIDVVHGTGSDEFEFKAGDTIKITGKAVSDFPAAPASDTWATPQIQFKVDISANNETDKLASPMQDDPFDFTLVLTAGDITLIETTGNDNPAAIRIGARPTDAEFIIEEITVTR